MEFKIKEVIILGILLIILGVFLHKAIVETPINLNLKDIPNSEQDIIDDCENLDLEDTSDCLVSNIKSFYIYNHTVYDVGFEKLIETGGDCRDWSLLYDRLSKSLGFNSYTFRLDVGEKAHRFAIINDETGYCILEQKQYECFKFGELNNE